MTTGNELMVGLPATGAEAAEPDAEGSGRPRSQPVPPIETEAYFRSLVENARDVIHVINGDRTTRYVTPSIERLLGYEPEALIGRNALELIHPDDHGRVVAELRLARRQPGRGRPLEMRVRHSDGSWRIFEGVAKNLLDDPLVRGMIVNSRDVTRHRRREEEQRRLAAFPRESPNPILELDLQGSVTYLNPAAARLIAELGLAGPEGVLPADHEALLAGCFASGEGVSAAEVEVDGRVLSWTYHPHLSLGSAHLFGEEVTERKRAEERLLQHALHDPLTGLANRHLFMERLASALMRFHRRECGPFAVLFLDLDRFKVVNDSLGHHVGDELLVAVAERLRASVRPQDTVARFGGDEFAVLLEDLDEGDDAVRIAERITAAIAAPVNLSGYELFTSASIGIALSSTGHDKPEYLMRNADVAMYRAKGAGSSQYEVFDRAMHAQALSRLQMETDLRRALSRGEFQLRYQPIVSLRTGRIAGLEALVRWQHPERGLLTPGDFIPLAEETGAIVPLGEWVLGAACAQHARWRADFPQSRIAISVNLSARQFAQRDLVDRVRAVLAETGLEPRHLKLEITESAVIDRAGSPGLMLEQFKELGIQVQMDDFGTGYSSLSCLHHLPLDGLKIDRSFVSRLETDAATSQLVRTIALLARGLELAVIAEGVETEGQLGAVRAIGCDYAQGFLIAPPLTDDEVRAFLAADPRF